MPRIIPEPRYFSMPSSDVGSEVFKNFAFYCCPWVRSLIRSPDAVIHSPAEITAACPTTVTSSRWPRALIRRTQKPRLTRARADRPQDAGAGAEGRSQRHQDRRGDREGQEHRHHHGAGARDDRLDQDRRLLRRHQARRPEADQGRQRRLSRRLKEDARMRKGWIIVGVALVALA